MHDLFSIGQLAAAGGVGVETVRYYQRRGLLTEPDKPVGGHRRYPTRMVQQLRFIRRAQALGFTLEEIEVLLQPHTDVCADTRVLAVHKLDLIDQKIRTLSDMRATLAVLVERCTQAGADAPCPILEALFEASTRDAWPQDWEATRRSHA
jgi:MerR family mercuric resistance operon transcriptional regulator